MLRGLCSDVAGLGRLAQLVGRERAAEMLGLSATTLWRKMKRLRIEHDRQS